MNMRLDSPSPAAVALAVASLALVASSCGDGPQRGAVLLEPVAEPALSQHAGGDPPPELAGAIAEVTFGPASLTLWPFTGTNFSGTPSDPVNLLFVGESDPANIRAALFALDGDRTAVGFPAGPPFDCTWRDAVGGLQTNWAGGQWSGSVLQLECGQYEMLRMHLRLFPAGDWTVANAHMDVLIPGTTDHQVLTWDLARDFVVGDLQRTGLLDPGVPFGAAPGLTPSPTFREIPAVIYNGLPVQLRALIQGPLADVTEPVGIANDGTALIANMAGRTDPVSGTVQHDFVVEFNQVVPKPICATSPLDWIFAQGPVRFSHRVVTSPAGEVTSQIQVVGSLEVTPFDVVAGEPAGVSRRARVSDHYSASTTGPGGRINSTQLRLITASGGIGDAESERVRLRVGPHGVTDFAVDAHCSG